MMCLYVFLIWEKEMKCVKCVYCDEQKYYSGEWYCNHPDNDVYHLPIDIQECFVLREEKK